MSKQTILLIEDSPEDAFLIRKRLQSYLKQPFHISYQRTMREAEKALEEHSGEIGLILLDLGLPDTRDGRESFERIKELAPKTPVVILTGTDDYDMALWLMKHGAEDFVSKNLLTEKPELLRNAIEFAFLRHAIMQDVHERTRQTLEQKEQIISWMSGGYSVEQ